MVIGHFLQEAADNELGNSLIFFAAVVSCVCCKLSIAHSTFYFSTTTFTSHFYMGPLAKLGCINESKTATKWHPRYPGLGPDGKVACNAYVSGSLSHAR